MILTKDISNMLEQLGKPWEKSSGRKIIPTRYQNIIMRIEFNLFPLLQQLQIQFSLLFTQTHTVQLLHVTPARKGIKLRDRLETGPAASGYLVYDANAFRITREKTAFKKMSDRYLEKDYWICKLSIEPKDCQETEVNSITVGLKKAFLTRIRNLDAINEKND